MVLYERHACASMLLAGRTFPHWAIQDSNLGPLTYQERADPGG
jgi:hypothetical protein